MMTSRTLFFRQPGDALTKFVLSALLLSVLAQAVVLLMIGQFVQARVLASASWSWLLRWS
jgi:hypothetical protein